MYFDSNRAFVKRELQYCYSLYQNYNVVLTMRYDILFDVMFEISNYRKCFKTVNSKDCMILFSRVKFLYTVTRSGELIIT